MKCNQYRPGFELVSPCSFPTAITTTPRAPPIITITRWGKKAILFYGPGDRVSIPGRVITKTQKMVLDAYGRQLYLLFVVGEEANVFYEEKIKKK